MTPSGETAGTTALVKSLMANSSRLGLTWAISFGIVQAFKNNITYVTLDGAEQGDDALPAVPLETQPATGARVSCLLTSPTDVYILGVSPYVGQPVVRWRRNNTQSIPDAGTGTFIQWDTSDLDVFKLFSVNTTVWTPPIAGWYQVSGRAVYTANATSRRAFFINKNATTGGTGTIGGQSLQTPATGGAQISAFGLVYMNGTTDFLGGRCIQNSGAPLNIDNTDGGSVFEAVYLGSPVTL
jgi:hypothetical protein